MDHVLGRTQVTWPAHEQVRIYDSKDPPKQQQVTDHLLATWANLNNEMDPVEDWIAMSCSVKKSTWTFDDSFETRSLTNPEADAWFSIYPLCFFLQRTEDIFGSWRYEYRLQALTWINQTENTSFPVGLLSARASHVPVWEYPWSVASGWSNVVEQWGRKGFGAKCASTWHDCRCQREGINEKKQKNQPISTNQLSLVTWGRSSYRPTRVSPSATLD